VPGWDLTHDYPRSLLRDHDVRFVMGGHWEDFMTPRTEDLEPVSFVLDEDNLNGFIQAVEQVLGPNSRGVVPRNKGADQCPRNQCGPIGPNWALPVPGETYLFSVDGGLTPNASPGEQQPSG